MTNDEPRVVDRLLEGLEPPPPPADLRARTLRAAGERMTEAPPPDLWWKIWNNRGLRLAWVAAVVLLVAGHILLSPAPGSLITPNRPVEADGRPDDRFLEILRPMQIDADAHPTIGRFAVSEDPDQIEIGGNSS